MMTDHLPMFGDLLVLFDQAFDEASAHVLCAAKHDLLLPTPRTDWNLGALIGQNTGLRRQCARVTRPERRTPLAATSTACGLNIQVVEGREASGSSRCLKSGHSTRGTCVQVVA